VKLQSSDDKLVLDPLVFDLLPSLGPRSTVYLLPVAYRNSDTRDDQSFTMIPIMKKSIELMHLVTECRRLWKGVCGILNGHTIDGDGLQLLCSLSGEGTAGRAVRVDRGEGARAIAHD